MDQLTLRQWILQNMRSGHLDRLDKPIVRVSSNFLRRTLPVVSTYSIVSYCTWIISCNETLIIRLFLQRLFAETPVSQLRKFLAYFSVTRTSSLSQKKAMEMCYSRFYRGSESSRQHAIEIFQSCRPCMDYLEQQLQTVRKEINSEAQILGNKTDDS